MTHGLRGVPVEHIGNGLVGNKSFRRVLPGGMAREQTQLRGNLFVSSKGVAANCASALAQMAAASCVQEEKEDKEVQEPSDAIAQGNS